MRTLLVSVFLVLVPMLASAQYSVSKSTFNCQVVTVSSTTPTLLSLTPSASAGFLMQSVSVWNLAASSIAYTVSNSATSSGAPALTCANGAILGGGTSTAPVSLTEAIEGMFLWMLDCNTTEASVAVRRVVRGR